MVGICTISYSSPASPPSSFNNIIIAVCMHEDYRIKFCARSWRPFTNNYSGLLGYSKHCSYESASGSRSVADGSTPVPTSAQYSSSHISILLQNASHFLREATNTRLTDSPVSGLHQPASVLIVVIRLFLMLIYVANCF